jgi:hypothetical protein
MIFRKSIKSPIETAIGMLGHAITIVYGYKHNPRYQPNDHDLKMIDTFTEELWEHYCTAKHIQRSLHERAGSESPYHRVLDMVEAQ